MRTFNSSRSVLEILCQDSYTPVELATLLNIDPFVVRHCVRSGDLKAVTYEHHILSIQRTDALEWLSRAADSTQRPPIL